MPNPSAPHDAPATLALFVYGSLLDADHRAEVIGRAVQTIPATLHGFARGRTRHWYLYRHAGATTRGLLLIDLTAEEFATLDRYEELPTLYTREVVEVAVPDGATMRCWVYLSTAWAPADEG
ncbi:MAG TPA: gamma-glutamylcyclotransferase family protein [Candidatus Binataceae bacterium]|nr:gamma-glutamylcyclotransferase family protein [Candidatus Binataceae bacterium]